MDFQYTTLTQSLTDQYDREHDYDYDPTHIYNDIPTGNRIHLYPPHINCILYTQLSLSAYCSIATSGSFQSIHH